MADIAFLVTIVAFFILCVGYVELCSRIIGPDEIAEPQTRIDEPEDEPVLERAA